MSRSGFIEDDGGYEFSFLNEGRVVRAIRGKRGQRALVDFVDALDAMPEQKLIRGSFSNKCGVCSLGALAAHRGVDVADLNKSDDDDPVDKVEAGKRLDIAPSLAAEVMWQNDDCWTVQSTRQRWTRMRQWAVSKLLPQNRGDVTEVNDG